MSISQGSLAARPNPQALAQTIATVRTVSAEGCEVELEGATAHAAIATHVPTLVPGQRVLVLRAGQEWLVIAAFSLPGQARNPFAFDPLTGTLRIEAPRLDISAVAAVELRCGEARVRLSVDGRVQIEGVDILSAATASHRIEGARIDLN